MHHDLVHCAAMEMMLSREMTLRETLRHLATTEGEPLSRFWFGSPCRFVRTLDVFVHIVAPEAVEGVLPGLARYLRSTSPRWGRSWREW